MSHLTQIPVTPVDRWGHSMMTFTSMNADFLVLDKRYPTDQLWLNLGQTFMFYPQEETVEPVKPPTKKWWKNMTTRRKIPAGEEYKNLFDHRALDINTLPLPLPRTRRITDRLRMDHSMGVKPTKLKVFVYGQKSRDEIVYWIGNHTLDLWYLSEMDNRDKIQDIWFLNSDDAMYFTLHFNELLRKE